MMLTLACIRTCVTAAARRFEDVHPKRQWDRDRWWVVEALRPLVKEASALPHRIDGRRFARLAADATRGLPRTSPLRRPRERLLLASVLRLGAEGFVRIEAPLHLTPPPRRTVLDVLDPALRLPSVHRAWQAAVLHAVPRTRDVATCPWPLLGALVLWGGPCGEDAIALWWALQWPDYERSSGLFTFRSLSGAAGSTPQRDEVATGGGRSAPRAGEGLAWQWTAHPVQRLALDHAARGGGGDDRVFPRGVQDPAAGFLDWLRGQVPAEDRPARAREITLTTARWMLELYPPWIVSIARGTFVLHDR